MVRDLSLLAPDFRRRFEDWLREARKVADVRVSETYRTPERQRQLVKAGLSRTMKSLHLTGKAVDIFIVVGGRAVWRHSAYKRLYQLVPLGPYKLRTIDTPGFVDLVHIEDATA